MKENKKINKPRSFYVTKLLPNNSVNSLIRHIGYLTICSRNPNIKENFRQLSRI